MQIVLIVSVIILGTFLVWTLRQLTDKKLSTTFQALSHEALSKNNETFLALAREVLGKYEERAKGDLDKREEAIKHLVNPMKESLHKLDVGFRQIEKERKGESGTLKEQLRALSHETATLSRSLRASTVRGRWGEIQLKRVVELAGMKKHCDFFEQQHEGGQRPDLLVRLPGEKNIVIDAKTPLKPFIEAMDSESEVIKKSKLTEQARLLKQHIQTLGKKRYFENFTPTPEFVVLFLPSEAFFSSALEEDPTLLEYAFDQNVILSTPTTLIALLRSIAHGWKQEALSQNAEEISELGGELYKRLSDMGSHFSKLGRTLSSTVESYNKAMGSLETRVLVSARKFSDLGAGSAKVEMSAPELLERIPKELTSPEFEES